MKKGFLVVILGLLILSLLAIGCPPPLRGIPPRVAWEMPPPQAPYPEPAKEWSQTFGGPYFDGASWVEQTHCGGFIIAGSTESFGAGKSDFWLIKTGPQGNKQWHQTFGGPNRDTASSVQQTDCRGFVIAGSSNSFGPREERWAPLRPWDWYNF